MPVLLPGSAHRVDRRLLLGGVAGVSASAALAVASATPADATTTAGHRDAPFTVGVASGDPTPSGVVLWTRPAPRPFGPRDGMPAGHAVVQWRVAADPGMRKVVLGGTAHAPAELAHSVHVEVEGPRPDTEYFYEFRLRNRWSPVGRTRTLPSPGADVRQLDFAFVSCQARDRGFFPSYRHMAAEDLDLVVRLGDYVHGNAIAADGGLRGTPVPAPARPAPRTLAQWPARYALDESDPDLQAAHARFPFVVTWAHDRVRSAHQVLRRRPARIRPLPGDTGAVAHRAAHGHRCRHPIGGTVHARGVRGRGRGARSTAGVREPPSPPRDPARSVTVRASTPAVLRAPIHAGGRGGCCRVRRRRC